MYNFTIHLDRYLHIGWGEIRNHVRHTAHPRLEPGELTLHFIATSIVPAESLLVTHYQVAPKMT